MRLKIKNCGAGCVGLVLFAALVAGGSAVAAPKTKAKQTPPASHDAPPSSAPIMAEPVQPMDSAEPTPNRSSALKIHYLSFEVNGNWIFQSIQAYSLGVGLSYTPRLTGLVRWMDLSARIGMQFSKDAASGFFVMPEFGLAPEFLVTEQVSVAPELGFGVAMSKAFAYLGGSVAYRLAGLSQPEKGAMKYLDRVYFRYNALLTTVTSHQLELGVGISFN